MPRKKAAAAEVPVGTDSTPSPFAPVSCGDNLGQLRKAKGEFEFTDVWYPIQVKQKDKVGRPDIDAFEAVMMREECEKGFFVSFDYSDDALREIDTFFKRAHKVIVPLTVQEILDEQIARKLA